MKALFLSMALVGTISAPAMAENTARDAMDIRARNIAEIRQKSEELHTGVEFLIRLDSYERCRVNDAIPDEVCNRISGMDQFGPADRYGNPTRK